MQEPRLAFCVANSELPVRLTITEGRISALRRRKRACAREKKVLFRCRPTSSYFNQPWRAAKQQNTKQEGLAGEWRFTHATVLIAPSKEDNQVKLLWLLQSMAGTV